jgi:hypothetical protein
LLDVDEVDGMVGIEAFSMECMRDESCNASPVLFGLWEYASSAHSGSLHVSLLSTAPTFARSDRRSAWSEWIRMLLIRFPVWVGDLPCFDLG